MKSVFLVMSVLLLSCTGCIKKDTGCTPVSPQSEEAQITAYTAANGITAVKHSSGMYYQIMDPGTGAVPNLNSKVSVTYSGKLLNGTQFDQSLTPISLYLSQVIEGWQVGIPIIKKGGRIKLIIPSSMGYGCNGAGTIPSNSVLFFDVTLTDVQ